MINYIYIYIYIYIIISTYYIQFFESIYSEIYNITNFNGRIMAQTVSSRNLIIAKARVHAQGFVDDNVSLG